MAKRDLQERFQELSVVAEVATAMLSPVGLQQVLDIAVEKVSREVGAQFGSITLLSPEQSTLDIVAVYKLASDYPEKVRRTHPLRADASSPSGRAIQTRRPTVVADVTLDPLFAPWRQLAEEEGFRSFIAVPLVVGEDAIGTLNQYLAGPHEFSAAEINMLTGVCRLVCVAIERAHLYEALKKQHETAAQASEKKSRFLAAVSHELRAPMTAIVGFTDLLLKQIPGPLNDDQRRQLRLLASSAQHLLLLIADVLDVAKIEAGKMECVLARVDAGRVVGEALEMMGPLAEAKGLALAWTPPAPPFAVRCDAQRCTQILVNLLSNAIKFTPQGRISVEARRDPSSPRLARISVSDTGVGVKPEDLPLLFEEFQQIGTPLAGVFRGSGLGLSLSRELAHLMGGDIEVHSAYGVGSTFTLVLEALS